MRVEFLREDDFNADLLCKDYSVITQNLRDHIKLSR